MTAFITSVLLPVFNGADYIESAINSVLAQDVPLEVLVQDDCSTDRTAEIVSAMRDPRIKYEKNARNVGCFSSLNLAAARAQGDLIRIFSHDDLMYPGDMAHVLDVFRMTGAGVVITDHDKIDGKGNFTGSSAGQHIADWPTDGTAFGSQLARLLYLNGCISGTQSTITVKRSVYHKNAGFTEWMRYSGDYDFLARHGQTEGLHYSRKITSAIRFHAAQLSKRGRVSAQSTRELSVILDHLESVMSEGDRVYCRKHFIRVHGKQRGIAALKALARRETDPFRMLFREFGAGRAIACVLSALPYFPVRALQLTMSKQDAR